MKATTPCPECDGTGTVWADFHGFEVEAECPYCGGAGRALRGALVRDGYPVPPEGAS